MPAPTFAFEAVHELYSRSLVPGYHPRHCVRLVFRRSVVDENCRGSITSPTLCQIYLFMYLYAFLLFVEHHSIPCNDRGEFVSLAATHSERESVRTPTSMALAKCNPYILSKMGHRCEHAALPSMFCLGRRLGRRDGIVLTSRLQLQTQHGTAFPYLM